MDTALQKLLAQTEDPVVLLLLVALVGLSGVCLTLFRAWCAEIKAHRDTIQDNIQWTRQNTALIAEVRQSTERFATLLNTVRGPGEWRP
jgi:hypothetical protein